MKIENVDKALLDLVDKFRQTTFFKKYVTNVYLCLEENDSIYFKTELNYSKDEKFKCYEELGNDFMYILRDVDLTDEDVSLYEV